MRCDGRTFNAPGGWPASRGRALVIPQATLIAAVSVGRIADDGGLQSVLWPSFLIALLGLAAGAVWRLPGSAWRTTPPVSRSANVAPPPPKRSPRRSPLDPLRPVSGEAASVVIGKQAELILSFIARFQPARFKSTIVPSVMLLCVLPISWVAALILLIAMPLIRCSWR